MIFTLLSSCKKESINCDYKVGCSNDIVLLMDTINQEDESYLISGNSSIEIEHYLNRYMTSNFTAQGSLIRSIENCEILADTSLKLILDGRDTIYEHRISPMMLDFMDVIDMNGCWTKEELRFCSSYQYLKGNYPDVVPTTKKFIGWNLEGKKYFAFRDISYNDTLYGWFEIELMNYIPYVYRYGKF